MGYTLPVAGKNVLGGIKVGDDFTITPEGVLGIKDYENILNSVNELQNSVNNGKKLIAEAIKTKGVYASETESFESLASKIQNIKIGISYETTAKQFRILPYSLVIL